VCLLLRTHGITRRLNVSHPVVVGESGPCDGGSGDCWCVSTVDS